MGRKEARRYDNNERVVELLKESEKRPLTPEEIIEIKQKYSGYGGLFFSNKNFCGQFFTPPKVTQLVVEMLGIPAGAKVLEPSCGGGAFLEQLQGRDVLGIELLHETARVAQLCYPEAKIVRGDALGMLPELEGQFDFVVGNPPFTATNEKYPGFALSSKRLENYFLELAVRALKPGGKAGLIVPDSILSCDRDKPHRQYVLDNCYYLATVSLPQETFYFTGTTVKTSLIIFMKKIPGKRVPDYQIFMAIAENLGWDSRGRMTGKDDLPMILEEFRRGRFAHQFVNLSDLEEQAPAAAQEEFKANKKGQLVFFDPAA